MIGNATITIRTINGLMEIQAFRYECFAVHPQPLKSGPDETKWTVTHVPSGLSFPWYLPTRNDAVTVMRQLLRMRSDWVAFNPTTESKQFKLAVRDMFAARGGFRSEDDGLKQRMVIGREQYATDLNGYGGDAE